MSERRGRNQKTCVICGKPFFSPPSDLTVTCGPACRSRRAANARHALAGDPKIKWTQESVERWKNSPDYADRMARFQVAGTQTAAQNPLNQRGPQNREARVWTLYPPDCNEPIVITNLTDWARKNYELFEPGSDDIDATAKRIFSGFNAIQQTLKGLRCSPRRRGSTSYKGWTMRSLSMSKEDAARPRVTGEKSCVTPEAVCQMYEQKLSIKEISNRLKISYAKVQKVLITEGMLTTTESIMAAEGATVAEIAAALEKTEKAVNARLPYSKCMYNTENPTENAKRIRKHRNKKENNHEKNN